jgi:hypothetical protein
MIALIAVSAFHGALRSFGPVCSLGAANIVAFLEPAGARSFHVSGVSASIDARAWGREDFIAGGYKR